MWHHLVHLSATSLQRQFSGMTAADHANLNTWSEQVCCHMEMQRPATLQACNRNLSRRSTYSRFTDSANLSSKCGMTAADRAVLHIWSSQRMLTCGNQLSAALQACNKHVSCHVQLLMSVVGQQALVCTACAGNINLALDHLSPAAFSTSTLHLFGTCLFSNTRLA